MKYLTACDFLFERNIRHGEKILVLVNQNHKFFTKLLQLIHDSSSLNKGNHLDISCKLVCIVTILFSVFSLLSASIEKIDQTLQTMFDHISRHLKVRPNYSVTRVIFNSFQFSLFGNVDKLDLPCLILMPLQIYM